MINSFVSIFWFRRDLRLKDNHGLFKALSGGSPVLPIFIFDINILDALNDKKDKRVSFIHQSLENLKNDLEIIGSTLLIVHDTPLKAFEEICSSFNVREVFTNHDYEPYAIKRDKEVAGFLKEKTILFQTCKDQVIFEKADVLKPDGKPYTVFTPYSKAWKQKFHESEIEFYHSEKLFKNFFKTKPFKFPSLEYIGFEKTDFEIPVPGVDKRIIASYDKTRNIPSTDGTSKLSVHLRFGTVSIRQVAAVARQLNDQFLNELIWREFFMMILFHFPKVVNTCFKERYEDIKWRNNENEFAAWCRGETGYPLVDAGMRQLNDTGYMHNRVRLVTASFLTKHLLIDWRWGKAYFAEKLLDYELSSNNGNWQWAAGCGCDAAPYFRIFNPTEQTKRFDPKLIYIKKWLNNLDGYFIQPIVEQNFARKRAIEIYKQALQ
jgi:deoxyribodipyrimidine photo-lyase